MNQTTLVLFALLVASDGLFIKKSLQTIGDGLHNIANAIVPHEHHFHHHHHHHYHHHGGPEVSAGPQESSREHTSNESKAAYQNGEDAKPTQEQNEETTTEDVGGKVTMDIDVRSGPFEVNSRSFINPGSNCQDGTKADSAGRCRVLFG